MRTVKDIPDIFRSFLKTVNNYKHCTRLSNVGKECLIREIFPKGFSNCADYSDEDIEIEEDDTTVVLEKTYLNDGEIIFISREISREVYDDEIDDEYWYHDYIKIYLEYHLYEPEHISICKYF